MPKAIFITGTGTDVGKTALSLAVALWARQSGLRAAYLKPVQCGTFPFGTPPVEGGDAEWIRALAGPSLRAHVTYRLRMAASPHLAAEREGAAIDGARMRRDAETLRAECDLLILEGSGGAAVPLDRSGATLAALAADLEIPALIACAPGLGTLHHTLSTVAYLKTLSAPLAGFAFCHREAASSGPGDDLSGDNRDTLAALTGLPFFGALPFSPALARGEALSPAEATALSAPLAAALEAWWNPMRA